MYLHFGLKFNSTFCCCSSCSSFGNWGFFRLPYLLNMPPSLYFQHFLAFCHYKILLVLLVLFLSQPKKTLLLQGFPSLLFRELYLEIKIYTWCVLVGPGISLFLGPLSGQSWKTDECMITHVGTHNVC